MFPLGKPSKRTFAKQLMRVLRELESDIQLEYDAERFCLIRTGTDGVLNLANVYEEHCSVPRKARKAHLARLASVFRSDGGKLPEDFEEAKSHLRPKIWSRFTFSMMELRSKHLNIPLYPLGSHLYCSLVYDTEHSMRSIDIETLEKWGVSYYEAMEIACRNLDEGTTAFAKLGDGFYSSISGDNYDSARILLLDRIQSFEVNGDTIAVAPSRDAMYVAGSEDDVSLKIMFDLTSKTMEEDHRPTSPLPLKLEDGEWIDWEPPCNHVLREQFDEMKLTYLGGLYADQKQALDPILEKRGDPVFVATFMAFEHKDTQKVRSCCVWSEGSESLLPQAQFISLVSGQNIVASGSWEHVCEIVGDLMQADESYYPIRYRVKQFPTDEQIQSIGLIELA